MTTKLFIEAIMKLALGIILVCLLIFLPAGDFFANGLLFVGLLFVPMLLAGIALMIKSPDLLKARLNSNEEQQGQKKIVKLTGLIFASGFVVAGLTIRFNWYVLPQSVTYVASVIFILAYILYAEVLRENKYLSRIVCVCENQEVIDTGLYSIVRHPMYSATVLLFLTIPLILGSIYAFLVFLLYPFIVAKRIKSEEEFLERELKGYREYKKKVKYRLIPFVW